MHAQFSLINILILLQYDQRILFNHFVDDSMVDSFYFIVFHFRSQVSIFVIDANEVRDDIFFGEIHFG